MTCDHIRAENGKDRNRMINVDMMKYVMMGLLLLSGYFFLLHAISKRTPNKSSMPLLSIVLFVIYAALSVPLLLILNQMGNSSFVLLTLLVLLACSVLLIALYSMIRNFQNLNKPALVLFILYMLALSYITLFSREEGHSRAILLRFDSISEAISKHSLEPLRHVFLNAIMFIPIGFFLPLIDHDNLNHFMYVGPMGLMITTLIEATQMFLKIGQCDIEDIVANTLGALLGLVAYKVFRIFVPREEEEYEDDEEEEEEEEEA